MDRTTSSEIRKSPSPPPERDRSRSPPRAPPEDPPPAADDLGRRTCPVCRRLFDSAKAMWGHSWVHRERRDHIQAISPAPPMPVGGVGVAVAVGPAGEVGGGRWHPWTIDSKAERDRTCPRCGRVFGTPKAMFGHLHVHYERPTSTQKRSRGEGSGNQPGPVAVVREQAVPPVSLPAEAGGRDEERERGLIDLNRPFRAAEREKAEEESPPSIDLNRTPPRS